MRSEGEVPAEPVRRGRSLLAWFAAAGLAALLLLSLGVGFIAQPQRATDILLDRAGEALGLRITASGISEYRLRGTPQLVLRGLVAQRPGDPTALLRAERVLVSLPWSTLQSRGSDLIVQRIELDAPVLDIPALQRWQATRPPGPTRIPTLRDGLRVVRGRVVNTGWSIDGIDATLPLLAPGQPLRAQVRGRFLDTPTRVPFDLEVVMTAPASGAVMTTAGTISIERAGWSLPGHIHLSGPVHFDGGDMRVAPAKIGFSGRYQSASSSMPFVLGAFGPLHFANGTWALDPATLVLRGTGPIPEARASGAIAFGRRLVLRLEGDIARWPETWPALPPPLAESAAPLAFTLDYVGRVDFSDITSLRLRRDQTLFDARFQLPRVQAWLARRAAGSPLPPLDGRLRTPRLEIAGAQLQGVELDIDDPAIDPPAPSP